MYTAPMRFLAALLSAFLLGTSAGVPFAPQTAAGEEQQHTHTHYEQPAVQSAAAPLGSGLNLRFIDSEGDAGTTEPDPEPPAPPTEAPPQPTQAPTVTEAPPQPTPETACNHNWVQDGSEKVSDDCIYGETWRAWDRCTKCGVRRFTAFRPEGGRGPGHDYQTKVKSDPDCPGNTVTEKVCSRCGDTVVVSGHFGHTWSGWTEQTGNPCGENYRTRTCTKCQAVDRQPTGATSHRWVKKTTASTCTTPGLEWQECSVCHKKTNEVKLPLRAHTCNSDGDCTTPDYCTVCSALVRPATTHNLSSTYSHDNTSHWKQCTNPGCSYKGEVGSHNGTTSTDCTRLSSCSVCGMAGGASGLHHNYTGPCANQTATTHTRRCSNPGCTQQSPPMPHDAPGPVTRCGETERCACGYPIRSATGSHNFTAWTTTSSGHSRSCTTCGYVESASHTGRASGDGCTANITCSTCGYVLSRGYADHSFGVWMAAGTTHNRMCTHPGCTAMQSAAHTGGVATCASGPICAVCGAAYGSKSANNHTGGTELRNDRPAEVGKEGYTGDTYCRGCGKVIQKGKTIPALAGNHTHAFTGAWQSDSSNHWKACACGEHAQNAPHTFANGVCTVCGAADPNHKVCTGASHAGGTELRGNRPAEIGKAGYTGDLYCTTCGQKISTGTPIPALEGEHVHEYSTVWRTDSASHWRDCSCGRVSQREAHRFANGICTVCGFIDPNAGVTAHAHTYSNRYSTSGQDHWRECTICGFQAERSAHVMLNGKCLTCGYSAVDMGKVTDVAQNNWYYEPVKQVLTAGLLGDGKTGSETTAFNPEQSVVLSEVADALYRLAGSPISSASNAFTDVAEDDYYAQAVSWVTGNDIVEKYGDTFHGELATTLQEMMTFLWRFAKQAGWDIDGGKAMEIADAEKIEDWAAEAMRWAAGEGLLDGIDSDAAQSLTPGSALTRAEAAVILANFMELVEANGLPGEASHAVVQAVGFPRRDVGVVAFRELVTPVNVAGKPAQSWRPALLTVATAL